MSFFFFSFFVFGLLQIKTPFVGSCALSASVA